jgi:tetratricopeptide (TPR) repeat protein
MRALALVVLLLSVTSARAAFDEIGAGARAPGLGDAFTALADDAYALHYNPAGLAQMDRSEMSASYSKLYTGLTDGSDLGASQLLYAHPLASGRRGTYAIGWDRFALSGLYTEQTLALGYGRSVKDFESGGKLMLGLNAKYLSHSFASSPEAASACSGVTCGANGSDPLLSGKTSKTSIDTDLGVLYRFPRRFQMGFMIQHANSPDVGFSGGDKLNRLMKLGLAYKSIWLSLVGEVREVKSAAGGTDHELIVGAERYFPTLDYGQFGVRGSVGLGSSDWKQMTFGASYRINKIQFDYGYLLPIGGISEQSTSHRLAMTFYFGAPAPDEELARDLLEQGKKLREHGPDYGYEYSQELRPQDLSDPRLAEVRRLIEERKYRLAHKALVDFAVKQPLSPSLLRLSNRLDLVASAYTDLIEPKDKFDHALVDGVHRFLFGQDRLSVLQVSYAYAMRVDDARLNHFLEELEKAVGIKADRLAPDNPRNFIDELLYRVEFANTRGDKEKLESILADILVLEPENATALERLGSYRYINGKYQEAILAWDAAAKLETRERELESIREYVKLARERAAGKSLPGGIAPAVVVPDEPAPARPAKAPRAKPAAKPVPAPDDAPAADGDPRDVQALYQKGIEFYARGEYLQAQAMFMRILRIAPDNEQARKALERIDRRAPKQ